MKRTEDFVNVNYSDLKTLVRDLYLLIKHIKEHILKHKHI